MSLTKEVDMVVIFWEVLAVLLFGGPDTNTDGEFRPLILLLTWLELLGVLMLLKGILLLLLGMMEVVAVVVAVVPLLPTSSLLRAPLEECKEEDP